MQVLTGIKSKLESVMGEEALQSIGILAAIVGVLSFLGPFRTGDDLGPIALVAYWSLSISAGYLGGQLHGRAILPALLRRKASRLAPVTRIAAITFCACVSVFLLEALLREPVPLSYAAFIVIPVLVISLAVAGIFYLRAARVDDRLRADPCFEAFRAQWPSGIRQDKLVMLSAEDHFVRVTTQGGEALVSMRFTDALEAVSLSNQAPGSIAAGGWQKVPPLTLTAVEGGGP
ncbi:MAG: hypothetical protein AAF225_06755 [Pseudomonadota bacterium]